MRYCSLTGRRSRRSRRRRRTWQLCETSITCNTPVLQAILDFFPDIISFQHVFHLGVGRSQIRWKLKVKTLISVFPWANIRKNDHSNPYIESTTVLSDYPNKMMFYPLKGALFIHVFLPVSCTLFHVYWLTDTSLLSLHAQEILKGTRRWRLCCWEIFCRSNPLIHIYEECLV